MSLATSVRAYGTELETRDGFTRNILAMMTETHRRFMKSPQTLKTTEYVEYVKWLCRVAVALLDVPVDERVSTRAMYWTHGDRACNCIWFEVIHASVKAGHAVLRDSIKFERTNPSGAQRRRVRTDQLSPMIAVMNFVIDRAFTAWIDNPMDIEDLFTRSACEHLRTALRAYALWNLACSSVIDLLPMILEGKSIEMDKKEESDDDFDDVVSSQGLRNSNPPNDARGNSSDSDQDDTSRNINKFDNAIEFAQGAYMWLSELPLNILLLKDLSASNHDTKGVWNPSSEALDTSSSILSATEARKIRKEFTSEDTWIANAKAMPILLFAYRLQLKEETEPYAIVMVLSAAEHNGANTHQSVTDARRLISSQSSEKIGRSVAPWLREMARDIRDAYFVSGLDLFVTMPDVDNKDRRRANTPARSPVCNLVLCTGTTKVESGSDQTTNQNQFEDDDDDDGGLY